MPSKSQMAFALCSWSIGKPGGDGAAGNARVRVVLVEEAATVVLVEDAGEAPRLVLEGLDVLDLDDEQVAGLGGVNVKGPGEVVDLCEVDVFHVVGVVVVANLTAGPVDALDLDNLVVGKLGD